MRCASSAAIGAGVSCVFRTCRGSGRRRIGCAKPCSTGLVRISAEPVAWIYSRAAVLSVSKPLRVERRRWCWLTLRRRSLPLWWPTPGCWVRKRGWRCSDAVRFALHSRQRFDIVFLDPPFHAEWLARLAPLVERLLAPDGVLYVEAEQVAGACGAWRTVRSGQAGQVCYHLMRRGETDGT